MREVRRIWQRGRAALPPPSSRRFSTIAALCGTAGQERWHIWEWREQMRCKPKLHKARMPMQPAFARSPPTRISSLSGKTPTLTSPSSSKPRRSTRSCNSSHRTLPQARHYASRRYSWLRDEAAIPPFYDRVILGMPRFSPRRRRFLDLSGREHATHNWGVHLVLSGGKAAVVVFYLQNENRQHAFLVESFLRDCYRQNSVQIVLAICGFVAMLSDIPGENPDLVVVKG